MGSARSSFLPLPSMSAQRTRWEVGMAPTACSAQSCVTVGSAGPSAHEMVPPAFVSFIWKSLMNARSRSPSPSTSWGAMWIRFVALVVIVYLVHDGFLNHTSPEDDEDRAT